MRLTEIVPSISVARADDVTYLCDACGRTENRVETNRSEQRALSGWIIIVLILAAAIAVTLALFVWMSHR
jgi:CHASE3 domain sensor protein